jgi:hypothetical protein
VLDAPCDATRYTGHNHSFPGSEACEKGRVKMHCSGRSRVVGLQGCVGLVGLSDPQVPTWVVLTVDPSAAQRR